MPHRELHTRKETTTMMLSARNVLPGTVIKVSNVMVGIED
jgi:hypothetical protein